MDHRDDVLINSSKKNPNEQFNNYNFISWILDSVRCQVRCTKVLASLYPSDKRGDIVIFDIGAGTGFVAEEVNQSYMAAL